jgi:hypothetical protein
MELEAKGLGVIKDSEFPAKLAVVDHGRAREW